jgi:hypothetical protein
MSKQDWGEREFERYEREADVKRPQVRENITDVTSRIRERTETGRSASERIHEGGERMADTISRTARKVRESAAHSENPTMSKVALKTASGLERGAEYLRHGGLNEVRADVEDFVRTRPAESLIAALAAGFLLGKIIRR